MATLQQMRSRAYGQISQTEGSSDITASEMNGFLNEGQRFLAPLIKWPRDMVDYVPVEGTPAYAVPSDFILLRNAYYGDPSNGQKEMVPLDIYTEETLKGVVPTWMSTDSTDRGTPRRIILLDRATFYINPTPDADAVTSGMTLRIGYVYQPADMTADGDSPDNLPVTYHDLIVDYAKYRCYNGKLNQPQEADRVLQSIVTRSKMLEPVVTKEFDVQAMGWGDRSDNMESDEGFGIVFGR